MRFTKKKYLEMVEAFRNKELDLYPNEIAKILNTDETDVVMTLDFETDTMNSKDLLEQYHYHLKYKPLKVFAGCLLTIAVSINAITLYYIIQTAILNWK